MFGSSRVGAAVGKAVRQMKSEGTMRGNSGTLSCNLDSPANPLQPLQLLALQDTRTHHYDTIAPDAGFRRKADAVVNSTLCLVHAPCVTSRLGRNLHDTNSYSAPQSLLARARRTILR